MKSKLSFLLAVSFIFMFSSCATIIHGTRQTVSISSNPSRAAVLIDGNSEGRTPVTVELSRKDHHTVVVNLDGYLPYETKFIRKVDGWIAGNIVFGGIIGLAVDAISGGMYKLTPDQIQGDLKNANTSVVQAGKGLYITVVLKPKHDWVKIGQLERMN